jgi:sugar/nucleoside kinase (ribokinase family)
MLGCVGNDEAGKLLTTELENANIIPLIEVNQDHPTSKCAVAIHERERSMLTQIEASKYLTMEFVKENFVRKTLIIGLYKQYRIIANRRLFHKGRY